MGKKMNDELLEKLSSYISCITNYHDDWSPYSLAKDVLEFIEEENELNCYCENCEHNG